MSSYSTGADIAIANNDINPIHIPLPIPPPEDDGESTPEVLTSTGIDENTPVIPLPNEITKNTYTGSNNNQDIQAKNDSIEMAVPTSLPVSGSTPRKTSGNGFVQLVALLQKIFITKIRTPLLTLAEFLTPILMMLILVAAHNLSTVTYVEKGEYVSLNFEFPGMFRDVIVNGIRSFNEDLSLRLRDRLFEDWVGEDDNGGKVNVTSDLDFRGDGGNVSAMFAATESTQVPVLEDNDNDNNNDGGDDSPSSRSMDSFGSFRGDLSSLLDGPFPTLSFSQYVTISNVISSNLDNSTINEMIDSFDFTRQWGNLITLGTLHFTPIDNPVVGEFMAYLNSTHPAAFGSVTIRTHESEEKGLEYLMDHLDERTWALINFDEQDKFKIRMNYTTLPNTARVTNYVAVGLNTQYQRYFLSGFMTLQRTLTEFEFFRREECSREDFPSVDRLLSAPMPTAAFSQNVFFTAVGYLLGMTMAMAFLYPMSRLVKLIVEEKETRMKQTLFILGVKPWAYFMSWVVSSLILFLFISIFVTLTLSRNIMKYSSPALIFLYIMFFSTATISFSFFISAFFSRAKLAAIVAPIALFVTLLPRWIFFGTNRYEATVGKRIASLAPCTAFAFGADILSDYEYAELGVQRWNVSEGDYSFATALGFLLFDTGFYLILAWYLDLVIPSQYGVRRHPLFFLSPRYWRGVFCCGSGNGTDVVKDVVAEDVSSVTSHPDDAEPPSPGMHPQILISGLSKRYPSSETDALSDLTLTLYRDQITCLLGHNGAGKTTTISVLTGLFAATKGDCLLFRDDVSQVEKLTRESGIGICPQHNVLFNELTVAEHLSFFAKIRGIPSSSHDNISRATAIGLEGKLSSAAKSLSGGMKRKLSVLIALTGNPPLVVLDEPTSGMDPYSRRATWELLRKERSGRVTLLTTHFMDEAEILADRIAVLKAGKLKCVGGSLFLKRRFGKGYTLRVVLDPDSATGGYQEAKVLDFIRGYIPDTVVLRRSGREVTYQFPSDATDRFPALFDAFDAAKESLGVTGGYGISNSTLGDVFIELAEDKETEMQTDMVSLSVNEKLPQGSFDSQAISATKPASFGQQIGLLFMKRLLIQKRDVKGFLFSIILPVLIIALVLLILIMDVPLAGPPLSLGVSLYESDGGATDVVLAGTESMVSTAKIFPIDPGSTVTRTSYKNSSILSEQLLDSYNNHSHAARYGAYVFNDSVPLSVTVDWDSVRDMIDELRGVLQEDLMPTGIMDVGSNFGDSINVTAANMASWFYGLSGVQPDNGVSKEAVNDLIDDIFHTVQNSTVLADPTIQTMLILESLLTQYAQDMIVDLQSTNSTEQAKDIITKRVNNTVLADYLEDQIDNMGYSTFQDIVNASSSLLNQYNQSGGIMPLLNNSDYQIDQWFDNDTIAKAVIDNVFFNSSDTVTTSQLFSQLSVLLGGNNETLNGTISLQYSSFVINWDEETIEVTNLTISTLSSTFELGDVSSSFNPPHDILIDLLLSFLPAGVETLKYSLETESTILHNSSSPHAVAAFFQEYANLKLHQCGSNNISSSAGEGADRNNVKASSSRFEVINHPLPLTAAQSIEIRTILSIFASLFILIPYCYIPAAFTVFIVRERVCKSKHLQLVSGVNMSAYWISTYLWDMLQFAVLAVLVMLVFLAYGSESAQVFVGDVPSFLCTFLLTLGYGASSLPFAYILSRHFNNHSNAQISILGIFFITGFVAVNAYFIMISIETTKYVAEALRPLFRLWPAYNVGDGFLQMSTSYAMRFFGQEDVSPLDWEICGKNVVLLFVLVIPYSILLLLLEYSSDGGSGGILGRVLRSLRDGRDRFLLRLHGLTKRENGELVLDDGLDSNSVEKDDDDVAEERIKVNDPASGLKDNASVFIAELWKVYAPSIGILSSFLRCLKKIICCCFRRNSEAKDDKTAMPKRAVRGLSTAIMPGETFGLLGVNGAGKTTTLSILTGDINPTSGDAYVTGNDVTGRTPGGVSKARKSIGFCPQVDPLLELMTGRDTLLMFGRLRGIPAERLHETVDDLIESLTLTPHANKKSGSYSGGNKRKLSLGVAIIGNPNVLFIDEASSGMDPVARRKMWDIISTIAQHRSVILTTHSMEEAEALCTRVAIMTSGRMRCLGSVTHLKNKFLDGYTVDIQCWNNAGEDDVDVVEKYVLEEAFKQNERRVVLAERHGVFLRFDVENHRREGRDGNGGGTGEIFRQMEEMKRNSDMFAIEDYSIAQCTLEQVFLRLAKDDDNGDDDA